MIKTVFALACAVGIAELAVATTIGARPVYAQTSASFFGPKGDFAGSAITRDGPQTPGGSSSSFYGSNGNFTGSSITHGNSTSFYGPNGNFTGSSTRVGNMTTFYGPNGNYQGTVTNTTPPGSRAIGRR